MKRMFASLSVVTVIGLIFVALAGAHNGALGVSAVCNAATGNYDVSWTVTADTAAQGPIKVNASNRAAIAVGTTTGTFKVFTESIPGTSTSVTASIQLRWSHDGYTLNASAGKELPGTCKKPVVVIPPSSQDNRQGYCDPVTGEYLNLSVGQDKVEPYASRHLVPAVNGTCVKAAVAVVTVPPVATASKPVTVKKQIKAKKKPVKVVKTNKVTKVKVVVPKKKHPVVVPTSAPETL